MSISPLVQSAKRDFILARVGLIKVYRWTNAERLFAMLIREQNRRQHLVHQTTLYHYEREACWLSHQHLETHTCKTCVSPFRQMESFRLNSLGKKRTNLSQAQNKG